MAVDGGATDQPFQHAVLKARLACFLQGQAAARIRAHHPQDVLLGPRVLLRRDFGIANLDQGLAAIAAENVCDAPNRKADDEEPHQDEAKCARGALSQTVEYHASNTFLLAVCNRHAEGPIC